MAYDTRQSGGRGYNTRGGGYNGNNSQRGNYTERTNAQYNRPKPIEPEPIPVDYVEKADTLMEKLINGNDKSTSIITTSKIRKIYALVIDIYNKENLRTEVELLEESLLKLMRLRVRIAYDAGREAAVKTFVERARLLQYIKGIGNSRVEMIRFARYMEALVAYHCYHGGKEY